MVKSKKSTPYVSDDEALAKARRSARASVISSTDGRYAKKVYTMKAWLASRVPPRDTMGNKELAMFLATHNGGIDNGNSARQWRSAWKYWQATEGFNVPSDPSSEELVKKQIAGLTYKAGAPEDNSADAIDSGRLHAMVTYLFMVGQTLYALAFLLIWYSQFRKSVIASEIKVKDVRFNTDLGTLIYSKRMKAANSKKTGPGLIGNLKEVDNLTALLKSLVDGRDPEERLFTGWKDKTANALIKEVAKKHGWGEGKWVVTSLRHGSSREAAAVLTDEPTVVQVETTRTTKKVAKRMGHTNVLSQKTYQLSHGKKK